MKFFNPQALNAGATTSSSSNEVLNWSHRIDDGIGYGTQYEYASRGRLTDAPSLTYTSDAFVARRRSILSVVEDLARLIDGRYRGFMGSMPVFIIESAVAQVIVNTHVVQHDDSSAQYRAYRTEEVVGYMKFEVSITADVANAARIFAWLDENFIKYADDKQATARWWYMTSRGVDSTSVVIKEPAPIHQECYPWLPNLDNFFAGYLASSATLLFLAGPPGTGKTSLLRHFIWKHKLRISIAYDDAIFSRDTAFIDFMLGNDEDVLVIEDADLLLTSRENSGNQLMSRFLNVSDGVLKFPKKKIIFTTNLHDFRDIDSALTRPGRCHGFVQSRALTLAESTAAAQVIARPAPREDRDYALAELYNDSTQFDVPSSKFGFAP